MIKSALGQPERNGNGTPVPLSIEERLAACEEKIARFEAAMFGAAQKLMENPMMSAMLPKEMKIALRGALEEKNGEKK